MYVFAVYLSTDWVYNELRPTVITLIDHYK